MSTNKEPKTIPGAIFHFTMKVHGRSEGTSAVRLSAYRAGARIRSTLTGRTYNYTRKTEVEWAQIFTPSGAPNWMRDRSSLWNAADLSETRKDAQLAREIEIALPLALDRTRQVDLLREWIADELVTRGMVADACLHAKAGNPHCHILMTLRAVTCEGFGLKVRDWNSPGLASELRASWARAVNRHLEKSGLNLRVDHRSYADQGIDLVPTIHVGRPGPFNRERAASKAIANAAIVAARQPPLPAPSAATLPSTTLLNQRRRRRPAHPQVTPAPFAGFGGIPSP